MPVDSRGVVDLEAAQRCIDEHTALVSCMQVGNETGAVQPIAPLCALARRKNPQVKVHVDGVQGFMRVPVHRRPSWDLAKRFALFAKTGKPCSAWLP